MRFPTINATLLLKMCVLFMLLLLLIPDVGSVTVVAVAEKSYLAHFFI